MEANLPPLFNLHGIINLEKLSELFTQLIDHVNKQNEKIQSLEVKLEECLKIKQFVKEIDKIEGTLNRLETTANKLDIQSSSVINSKK